MRNGNKNDRDLELIILQLQQENLSLSQKIISLENDKDEKNEFIIDYRFQGNQKRTYNEESISLVNLVSEDDEI
jgi:hypothetical protein